MKLYTDDRAPNPRRVQVYLAEKGLELPLERVSLRAQEQISPEYIRINPDGVVPTLVLDDGTVIGESLAICRCLEVMHPEPPLFGRNPREIGLVEAWLRRIEIQGYLPVQDAYRNGHPAFEGRALPGARGDIPQIPQLVERADVVVRRLLDKLDDALAEHSFVVDDTFTMVDIVLWTTLEFGRRTGLGAVQDFGAWSHVARWHDVVSARPSVVAVASTSGTARPSG